MSRAAPRHLPWLAGFVLTVNLYLVPPLAASPRATDLAGVLVGVWALWALARGELPLRPLILVALAVLAPGVWLFFGILDGDPATMVQAARWLLAAPLALAFLPLLRDAERRRRFAWGLLTGGVVNVAVIVLQVFGFEEQLRLVGLSSSGAAFHNYVLQMVRFPGLHGHHNASAAVISLMAPAALYLYFRRECGLGVLLGVLAVIAVALHLTSTRSPLLAVAVTIVFAAVATRRPGRILAVAVLLVGVVAPLIVVYGPPGGWSRWRDTDAVSSNVQERELSNLGTAQLVLERPWGWGVEAGKEELNDRTSISATHDAFLQAALFFGLPFGALVLVAVVAAILGAWSGTGHPWYLPGLLAVQAGVLFLSEEHFNNPTFVVLALWWVALLGRRGSAGPAGSSDPVRSVAEDLPPVG